MVTGVLSRRRGGRRGGDLRDRRALVTGASGGLGEAITRRLHAEGARLVLSARRTSVLEGLAAELGDAEVVPADLGRVEDAVALSERAGGPDVLVANAGLPATGNLLDLDVGDIRRAVDLNVCGTLVLTRLLLPAMVERGWGHVLLVESLAGLASTPRSSVYNSSTFALRGFGHALREELRDTGVGVSLGQAHLRVRRGMWADTRAAGPPPRGLPRHGRRRVRACRPRGPRRGAGRARAPADGRPGRRPGSRADAAGAPVLGGAARGRRPAEVQAMTRAPLEDPGTLVPPETPEPPNE